MSTQDGFGKRPCRRTRVAWGGMFVVCLFGVVHAEMSGDDYGSTSRLRTPQERQQVEAELRDARQTAQAIAEQERLAEQARRQQAALQEAARPLGERLLQSRCTTCHGLGVLQENRKSALGWRWTVERMRWWHGAALGANEARVLSAHLTREQAGAVGLLEVGVLALLLLSVLLSWTLWRRWRRQSPPQTP